MAKVTRVDCSDDNALMVGCMASVLLELPSIAGDDGPVSQSRISFECVEVLRESRRLLSIPAPRVDAREALDARGSQATDVIVASMQT